MNAARNRRNATDGRGRKEGFTLLELVAVIGIIAIMAVVVVGGYNGIVAALSRDTGESAIRRALNLACQQACVDGQDVYFWVTGIDSYAIVRKAGTVTGKNTGALDYEYAPGKKVQNLGNGRAVWVYDGFADLTNVGVVFPFDETYEENDVRAVFDQYNGLLVFDMDAGKMANVIVPPWYNHNADAWVFGVNKDEAGSGFTEGHGYGWLVVPEQYLPKGYAFNGSFDSEGVFKKDYRIFVHYLPDGSKSGDAGEADEIGVLEIKSGSVRQVRTKNRRQ